MGWFRQSEATKLGDANLGEDIASETTRLLLPAPASTDLPSKENLRELMVEDSASLLEKPRSHASLSEIQLRSFKGKGESFYVDWDRIKSRKNLCQALLVAAIGACIVAYATVVVRAGHVVPCGPPFNTKGGSKSGVRPLSVLDPVKDLGLASFQRPKASGLPRTLDSLAESGQKAFPTNSWYQNLLLVDDEPSEVHRTYSVPYVIDSAGSIPGIRVHANHVGSSTDVVQVYVVNEYGLTLGASASGEGSGTNAATHRYQVEKTTNLAVTLRWEYFPMTSSIVKGMPYVTMVYDRFHRTDSSGMRIVPTIASQIDLLEKPVIDGKEQMECNGQAFRVEKEIHLLFKESDFTWLAFFSEPVAVKCLHDKSNDGILIQVVDSESSKDKDGHGDRPLVIRVALFKSCSSGQSPIYCHQEQMHPTALLIGQGEYGNLLRKYANVYPGPNTTVQYEVVGNETIEMEFNWDARVMSRAWAEENGTANELVAFALPHHFDLLENGMVFDEQIYCWASLLGPACLVEGSNWTLRDAVPNIDLRAPRQPAPWAIKDLATSLHGDLGFTLPRLYRRGAGDTYFSGKMLAKLARIVLVAEEVSEICAEAEGEYHDPCREASIPSSSEIKDAVSRLKASVEVWLNGNAETPFVYDSAWGGVVSCGCDFEGSKCKNIFPNCPAFFDPGLNFGNGFYNDMHFHYGYFIFAAAVTSHFDPIWGRENFENVLLLIRNIANPGNDGVFTEYRHKDWYQGHSWASGLVTVLNGKNQESSSEAIAAYEAIALYGKVMAECWSSGRSLVQEQIANDVHALGLVLTASELRSARTYWHVSHSPSQSVKIYPNNYANLVIGIVWQTMSQFQTWFGRADYLVYGIQLLPLTPVSELRDDVAWAKEIYKPFSESCEGDFECMHSGWSVTLVALLATAGQPQHAMEKVLELPDKVFDDAAGDGHSLSNTLWFISTRPKVDEPLSINNGSSTSSGASSGSGSLTDHVLTDCHRPDTCTSYALDTIAGLYSCRQRILWLIQQEGKTQEEACARIAGVENPNECGACNPYAASSDTRGQPPTCPPCSSEECASDLNRCPRYENTFLCTQGLSEGGCSGNPWSLGGSQCQSCCELTHCPARIARPAVIDYDGHDGDCPPCSPSVCKSRVNQCPAGGTAPFLCYEGASTGGCATRPWVVGSDCRSCCKVGPQCHK